MVVSYDNIRKRMLNASHNPTPRCEPLCKTTRARTIVCDLQLLMPRRKVEIKFLGAGMLLFRFDSSVGTVQMTGGTEVAFTFLLELEGKQVGSDCPLMS